MNVKLKLVLECLCQKKVIDIPSAHFLVFQPVKRLFIEMWHINSGGQNYIGENN